MTQPPADAMDIDLDLDLGPIPEPEILENDIGPSSTTIDTAFCATLTSEELQAEKVNVSGVDERTTDDIKQFAREHYATEEPGRVEWIDDTSANLIYSSAESALQALTSFTRQSGGEASILPPLQPRPAKSLSSHPNHVLVVRLATISDKKKPKAHESSRFYLMHPEHDPREKMRKEFGDRRRGGRRNGPDGEYNRRRYDEREERRRRDRDGDQNYDASMYDDEGSRGQSRDRQSRTRDDLFEGKARPNKGRLRNRSASPGEVLEGDEMSEDDNSRSRRRFRERSPPPPYQRRDPHPYPRNNSNKELFPQTTDATSILPSEKELFPNKTAASKLKKELFPNKSPLNKHRRSDAFDAADETADLLGKRMAVPFVDGSGEARDTPHANVSKELFPESDNDIGLNIRGAAQDQGMSIRGTSGISIKGRGNVKELFPNKFSSNQGKELFSDKLEGRGGRRRRAEDMFT